VSCLPTLSSRLVTDRFTWCFNSPREVSCLPTCQREATRLRSFLGFQFPTGSVLSADPCLSAARHTVSFACFNSPREVSCLPTVARQQCRQLILKFQFPTGSVLSADATRSRPINWGLGSFNSPREVSCLPTRPPPVQETPVVLFQFPTGSVLSADSTVNVRLQ